MNVIRNFHVCKPAVFLFLVIGIIYFNSLNTGWHFDDLPNITENSRVHAKAVSVDALLDSFYATPTSQSIARPLSYFSFALNWIFWQDNATGYHAINIAFHMVNSFFLFLIVIHLFSTPNLKDFYTKDSAYFIALVASVLWAVNPIHTQAVTYIVQRMASLAALFYLLGLLSYVRARMSQSASRRLLLWGACAVCYVLALASKENAALLPVSLILVEFLFFQDISDPAKKRRALLWSCGIALIVAVMGVLVFLGGNLTGFLGGFEKRAFTLFERLMTQPRVILFYVTQIFYPIPSRLSIVHDFQIFSSLINPWTTLPAILIIFGAVSGAFIFAARIPVLSFAALFFFLNHLIESTILPLEMVFEHRNYLPSAFLFVPVAMGIHRAIQYYQDRNPGMKWIITGATIILIISLGTGTYLRNMDWRNNKTLWTAAMEKAPNSARPLQNLAWGYYTPAGQFQRSINLYKRSLELKDDSIDFKMVSYNNLADIYYSHLKDYEKSLKYAKKAVAIKPDHATANYLMADSLVRLGRKDEAFKLLNKFCEQESINTNFLYLKGRIALDHSYPATALDCFRQCLARSKKSKYLREIGFSFMSLNKPEKAYWFFKWAETKKPDDPKILIALADNRLKTGSPRAAKSYISRLIRTVGPDAIENYLGQMANSRLAFPVSWGRILPLISNQLREKSVQYSDMASRLNKKIIQ